MEYPYGHPTTHTHHHNREEQEYPPPSHQPPPPPFHGGQPPPPYYSANEPPPYYGSNQPPPPQIIIPIPNHHHRHSPTTSMITHRHLHPSYTSLTILRIDTNQNPIGTTFAPTCPHSSTNTITQDARESAAIKTVRVCTKAKTDYSLTIREGKVILAPSDPSDPLQHWIKDEKYSIRVKDEEGFPSFALVNKATGQAIKHSIGATHPVQLIPYNPDYLDESVLWTESKDLGDGYRTVRMVNNIRLNVDAFNGDKNHGGVYDGTTIVLWEWKKGDNQRWKIVPLLIFWSSRCGNSIVLLHKEKMLCVCFVCSLRVSSYGGVKILVDEDPSAAGIAPTWL
ncbi:hydroxyproline-rich glycoprotein family protein [Actinidia rufa]|uniref:Hydroxyproline-rich glycoprotein family protein n=1 Tax=Actinidia rufa TaxID=165716 RepID=A0A7J0FMC4_9ERIC|nr:hydroxyproline-rich glycoprotein family protein [Actinidia rufa]